MARLPEPEFARLVEENLRRCVYNPEGEYKDCVNWVDEDVVSADAGNQGPCSSCWAWVPTEAIENLITIHDGKQCPLLSPQCVMDTIQTLDTSCKGGEALCALEVARTTGICTLEKYKYYGKEAPSQLHDEPANKFCKIDGWRCIKDTEEDIINALKKQPVIVAIPCYSAVTEYKRGLLDLVKAQDLDISHILYPNDDGSASQPGNTESHNVLIVGYGTFWPKTYPNISINYWMVKNQWGKKWGENGFGYIIRDSSIMEMEGHLSPDQVETYRWYFAPVIPQRNTKEQAVAPVDKVQKNLPSFQLRNWVTNVDFQNMTLVFLFYQRGDPDVEEEVEKVFLRVSSAYEHDDDILFASIDLSIEPHALDWIRVARQSNDPILVLFNKASESQSTRTIQDIKIYDGRISFFHVLPWLGGHTGRRFGHRSLSI